MAIRRSVSFVLARARKSGEIWAIPTLAYYYYSGIGTDVDKAKAKTLFEQAARNGDKYSQDFLSKQTF